MEIDKDAISADSAVEENSGEHEDYSAKVQKRIDKLTKKAREAERQQQAAIAYAQGLQQENSTLKGRVHNLDVGYVSEYGDRINSQTETDTREMQDAVASGDTT